MDNRLVRARRGAWIASLMGAAGIAMFTPAIGAMSAEEAEAQAQEAWRENIVVTAVPGNGCFHATYPSSEWTEVQCVKAPDRPFLPRRGSTTLTVGDGVDYLAESPGLTSAAIGSFPVVTGVTSEKDDGVTHDYSLQLNSNFMVTAACDGISGCLAWEQFVYSSGEEAAFMQYWLIDYGDSCPSGWNSFSPDCYVNSEAVAVPDLAISQLDKLKLSGTAVKGGLDTLVFTHKTEAYSVTGEDSVVDLATAWQESEFNIFGDGGGSEAVFNKGSSVTVKLAITDKSKNAPTCVANAGTTAETNNLSLSSCTATGAAKPYIEFVESN